ncbi:hypothetical protein QQF64_027038 [Cirrhinus molitorella]|uniref:Uncharacterized protein n=1 Tax=Cirrhinus molitorella TaxID=172907 RepID=A0ABR3NBG0_9TELE
MQISRSLHYNALSARTYVFCVLFTLSDKAEKRMLSENVLPTPTPLQQEVILVGCGGKVTKPTCMYEVELKIYGESCLVSDLVVPSQQDDLIIGTNVITLRRNRKLADVFPCVAADFELF